jgi:mRNA-degrading endonuclease RelE of RelBE toxin-antitoxin system
MRIALTERFQQDARELPAEQRNRLLDVLLALPKALGTPHVHAGVGLRKIHATGIWEARLGLGLRVVFTTEAGLITLVRVGDHDEIRRYLKTL